MVNKLTRISPKLTALEQSKVNQAYKLPFDEYREKPSYALIIIIFISISAVFLTVVKQTQAFPFQNSSPSSTYSNKSSEEVSAIQIQYSEEEITPLSNKHDDFASYEHNIALTNKPVLFSELPKSIQNDIPAIKLNGIVVLDNEEDSYVLINMIKYYAEDVVDFDLFVDRISQNSVVMNFRNKRFILTMRM